MVQHDLHKHEQKQSTTPSDYNITQ